jgi:2-C-methyl-D-erythritol 4-phosphate cytidylyltransferase
LKVVKTHIAVVPAAGIGSRMKSSIAKQYLKIGGQTVIEHTLDALLSHPQISDVIVVLHPQDTIFDSLGIADNPAIKKVVGGDERVDSVLNGLKYCSQLRHDNQQGNSKNQWVLVHDAARPCLTHAELDDLLATTEHCDGAILAIPVVDTIKQGAISTISCKELRGKALLTQSAVIQNTVDRTELWQAHTPQFFPLKRLIDAIQTAQQNNIQITDEASAMEHINAEIKLIEGRSTNIKITRPSDLALAEFYLNNNNNKQRGSRCSA